MLAFFLYVSPGWADAMQIPFVEGRDFRPSDTSPGAAIVNETFARQYFNGEHPLGKLFAKGENRYQVVGVVRDAPYRSVREPIVAGGLRSVSSPSTRRERLQPIRSGTFIVRTRSANPLALASTLRREVPRARSEFRVSNVGTQEDLVIGRKPYASGCWRCWRCSSRRSPVACGHRFVWRAGLWSTAAYGGRSAFAWRSARRQAVSHGS